MWCVGEMDIKLIALNRPACGPCTRMYVYFLLYYGLPSSLSCVCMLRDDILELRIKVVFSVTHVFNGKTRQKNKDSDFDFEFVCVF